MIDSGVGLVGKLSGEPEDVLAWGRSEQSALFYDLASLTKIVVTNSLLLEMMVESGKSLGDFRGMSVGFFLKSAPEKIQSLPIGQVWDHAAGLKDHFHLGPLKTRSAF